ncbi:MAG: LPS export ABC transporter permease LptG [Legionellales bacterium]|nr:LPS export ABC transporter permease LptG [Legionellales bacterium]|tara:strand:- start:15204 stop:16265 length:1062 start_codon:yes stop_codon:yes gene_type:complete
MKILDNYIARTIIGTTLLVVAVIVAMDFFIRLVGEFNDVGKGAYNMTEALYYVVLLVPTDVYTFFPMAGLIGGLIGLGLLASNSELIVMRGAGMSITQISRAVLYGILIMVFVVTLAGEFFGPRLLYRADSNKAVAKSGGQALATQHGIWLRDSNSFIHIDTVFSGGELAGITRYQLDDQHRMTRASHAQSAVYQGKQWRMKDIAESIIGRQQVTTNHEDNAIWDMQLNPTILKVAQVEPDEMPLNKLYSVIKYNKQNNLNTAKFSLQFWQRIIQPLSTCVMMLLALPFIFGPLRTATMGLRIFSGVIVGFGFYILNQFFGPFSLVYQFPPFLAAIIPTLVFAGAGFFLMKRR